MWSLIFEIHT
jgi:hypothetical protein